MMPFSLRPLLSRFVRRAATRGSPRRKQTSYPPRLEALEDRTVLATFTVNNNHDTGIGSLRLAIADANATPGTNTIAFNIPSGTDLTIRIFALLPPITHATLVDGTTQPGYDDAPIVVVNGSLFNAGFNGYGLDLSGSGIVVRGLVINGFTGAQVRIDGPGDDVLAGNYLGTDVTGTTAVQGDPHVSNSDVRIQSSAGNLIGGTTDADRNLISGSGFGVQIAGTSATGNVVEGNYIGTDVSGTHALGNADAGVFVESSNNTIGGTDAGAGNLLSDNGEGIDLTGDSNQVQGNSIGTDVTGTHALGNQRGLFIASSNNTIGGTDGAGNLISANQGNGIEIFPNNSGNVVQGNWIGTDVSGTHPLGNGSDGVLIESSNNTIGGTAAGAGNVISANGIYGIRIDADGNQVQGNFIGTDVTGTHPLGNQHTGLRIFSSNNTIGGTVDGARNVLSANQDAGLDIVGTTSTGNVIEGNFIGTDVSGTHPLGNFDGLVIVSPNNTIGGTAAGAGNLISGNRIDGIFLSGQLTNGNVVQGNFIGTDVSGTHPLGNLEGVDIGIASNNTIGGTAAGAGNLISGNTDGIFLSSSSSGIVVQGNFIGTDVTGTHPLGNVVDGVDIETSNNTIGGTAAGAGNVISGNGIDGIFLSGPSASGNVVQGNFIGTDITGTRPLGNLDGVDIESSNNTIGGTEAGAGNLISGNRIDGIELFRSSSGNVVRGNFIGTDVSGTQPLGNGSDGVLIETSNNTIGGTAAGAGNVISGNQGNGIVIFTSSSSGNVVRGNFIGTDVSGTQALGNGGHGVEITAGAHNNAVGGIQPGAANTIAFNGNDGVLVDRGTGNAILHNAIFANAHLGIELLNGGNNNQAAPTLTSASSGFGVTTIQGTFTGQPSSTYTLEFFDNDPSSASAQGQRFLGSVTVTTDATGMATFTVSFGEEVPVGDLLTATATDATGNTSAFSLPVEVTGP